MGLPIFLGHIPRYTRAEIDNAISEDDRDILIYAGISAAHHDSDWKYAQDLCILLYDHPNKTVRGNAILGLSYIAHDHGNLDRDAVESILLRALRDSEEEVRIRAKDTIREINSKLSWNIAKEKLDYRNSK